MFKKIYIENFRCFDKIVLDGLKSFNIVIGKNNVGKTAFLEAIFLHIGSHNPDITFKIDQFRGIVTYELKAESVWSPLFHNLNTQRPILIRSFDELQRKASSEISIAGKKVTKASLKTKGIGYDSTDFSQGLDRLKLVYSDTKKQGITAYAIVDSTNMDGAAFKYERPEELDFKKGMFISTMTSRSLEEEAQRFSKLQIAGNDEKIIEAMQKIEPRLKKLLVVPIGAKSVIYADIGFKKAIAVNLLGEGVVRLLQILLALSQTEDGIVVIDEIERGFHYEFYYQAIKIIAEFAQQLNIQIIATTHNRELLMATNQLFQESNSQDLFIIRLDKHMDEIVPTYYDLSKLKLVFDEGWEIR